jgi:hypothetical protein
MKLRSFKWGGVDDPTHVVIDIELASEAELQKMMQFLNWLEREEGNIPVDRSQELQEDYEANKPNLCPHGMNPVSCFDPRCRQAPTMRRTISNDRPIPREESLDLLRKRARGDW